MNFEEKDIDLSSAKKVAEVELRQREIYWLVSAEKREALLLQRRCAADVQCCYIEHVI
ncbi:MAG: hypothetical protein Q8830_03330 [Candidatus Phytoplasma australasiaticum]|nr:hypothetical protein [Candidatus Phytoplasma australasiaticum]